MTCSIHLRAWSETMATSPSIPWAGSSKARVISAKAMPPARSKSLGDEVVGVSPRTTRTSVVAISVGRTDAAVANASNSRGSAKNAVAPPASRIACTTPTASGCAEGDGLIPATASANGRTDDGPFADDAPVPPGRLQAIGVAQMTLACEGRVRTASSRARW